MHPSLRLPIFRISVNEGGQSAYAAIKNEYLSTKSIDGREICLQAMGRVQSTELARDFLNFQFGEHVAVQDAHTGTSHSAYHLKHPSVRRKGLSPELKLEVAVKRGGKKRIQR